MFKVDKLLHFSFSGLIFLGLAVAANRLHLQPLFWAIAGAVMAGASKELVWDLWLKKGDPSWADFGADCLGILLGIIIYLGLK